MSFFDEAFPQVGEQGARTALVEPVELCPAQSEDAAQHKFADAVWMGLGVGQGQCRSPRAAEHLPALNVEMHPQALEIADQIPRRVLLE